MRRIERNKPIILAPNHVNAFVDPIVIASMVWQDTHFFARSDVFKTRFNRWVLGKQLKISPMYRIQEGFSNLRNNNKTFEICKNLLSKNKTVILYPEGLCIMEYRLRRLKKGLARILFDTEEQHGFEKGVKVLPMALNYSAAHEINSKLFINIGDPIDIKPYKDLYQEDKVKAINKFTSDLEEKMKELYIHIDDVQYDQLYYDLNKIYIEEKVYGSEHPTLEQEHEFNQQLAKGINRNAGSGLLLRLMEKIEDYKELIGKYKIEDKGLYRSKLEKQNFFSILFPFVVLLLLFPFFMIGSVTGYPCFYLAKKFAKKKVKNIEFYASIYSGFAMVLWMVAGWLQFVAVWIITGSWWMALIYYLIISISGLITVWYYRLFKRFLNLGRILNLTRKSPDTIEEILIKRLEIIKLADQVYNS